MNIADNVSLIALTPLFTSIEDRDDNGKLSAGDILNKPVLATDVENLETLDVFIERQTGRDIKFIADQNGNPAYLTFSNPGASELAGIIHCKYGYLYDTAAMESGFVTPDFSKITATKSKALESCRQSKSKSQEKECRKQAESAANALQKSAENYNTAIDLLNDAYTPVAVAFQNNSLVLKNIEDFLEQFRNTQEAKLCYDLAEAEFK
jgi:hypothetical protein